ncbi:MAG: hypothetical protein QM756_32680 [Polyangiaceae bacterium]
MQAAIEIPSPNPSDSDTVVTALETAAVFSAKGDTAEAIRWLQRAAESAGEAGDDARTLTLARTAAELTRTLQSVPAPPDASSASHSEGSAPRRLPKPPPLKSSSFPAPSRPSVDEQSSANSSMRPPPPSARVAPAPPSRPVTSVGSAGNSSRASGTAGTTSVAPRPQATSSAPKSIAPSGERRRPALVTPSPSSVAPRSVAEPARTDSEATGDTEQQPAAAASAPQPSEAPAPTPQAAPAPTSPSALNPPPKPSSTRPPETSGATRLRSAARVSVVASSTEPGLFFVRLLDEGQAAPSSSTEAMMVLLNPASTLFSG